MVKMLALLVALCGIAQADDDGLDDGPPTLLGARLAAGRLPVMHEDLTTFSLALAIEHPMSERWHAFGEYEYVWLSHDDSAMQHGNAHRMLAGLRATVLQKRQHRRRSFVDLEAGGGMSIATDTVLGTRSLPTGFGGVRAGFDFYADDSPSRVFELEMLLRAVIVPDGSGLMAGLGWQWGN
jgi:hypothetical protein